MIVKKDFTIIVFFLLYFSCRLSGQEYKGILCLKTLEYFQIAKSDYITQGSLDETKTLNIISDKLPNIKDISVNSKSDNLNPRRIKKYKYLMDPAKEKLLTFSLFTDSDVVKNDIKKVYKEIKKTVINNKKSLTINDFDINRKTIKNGVYLVYLIDAEFFNEKYEQLNVDSNKKVYLYRLLTEEDIE
ncbi:hypothetical protein [Chryseobacterium vrystaatense]|uniref:Uncharacterized protein n=1 Tax=Chryseobacterium vrystaatense TaxID=307480 RepID=A0A1M5LQG4_9FLAO|nr:hypothetical protein [Chryseobacterium vrystaatense]SHG67291.1 hypothetical protein SAMN02787073_4624 [Chryseobacterium vrystaatense]